MATITQDMVNRPLTRALAKTYGGKLEDGKIVGANTTLAQPLIDALKHRESKADSKTLEKYAKTAKDITSTNNKMSDPVEKQTYNLSIKKLVESLLPSSSQQIQTQTDEPEHETRIIPYTSPASTPSSLFNLRTTKGKIAFVGAIALGSALMYYHLNSKRDTLQLKKDLSVCQSRFAEAHKTTSKAVNQARCTLGFLRGVCSETGNVTKGCQQEIPYYHDIMSCISN